MRDLDFDEVQPDKAGNWVNLTNNDFDTLIPLASKETKAAKTDEKEGDLQEIRSGSTARDEWVYDLIPIWREDGLLLTTITTPA